MNYGGINTSDAKTTAQKQPANSAEANSALVGVETDLDITKVKSQKFRHITIEIGVCILIIFAIGAIIFILSVALIHFLGSDKYIWLKDQRLNEFKALLTGGAGTVMASVVVDTIRNKNKK